ncbi:D-hexose-6-phosphate mutarotase [Alcanivorax sediminis]|uniref:Putative glucose-6-phosphate 1-epimerase n=1 Tax=Alcanivorax sediminis TaxID=2663008 RepID=A0A6N7LQA5_9GAMM|nr:D-hexose-6-phosphate mutarotase [Alcanivorax sediminis]MQX52182.1 D-hexose-6-phosphate mutarotase [Alcanivorax sediminis]
MPTGLTQITRGELACWQVRHRGQTLVIAEQGAQVLEYRLDNEPPVLWLSEKAQYHHGQGIRGGVPVCWPWFGGLAFNPETVRQQYTQPDPPAHGLVRALPWTLVHTRQSPEQIELAFQPDPDSLPESCPAVQLTLKIILDNALTLSLENHNQGEEPMALTQALHSYFAVSDIRQVTLQGLDLCPYVDAMDNWHSHRQSGPLTFREETDRLYLQLGHTLHIDDPEWQRRITLSVSGSESAVVWNPWIDKSQRLSQFADDAWQRMVCIETARVLDNALFLAAGECHDMSVRFVTSPL